jgi:hypothetical protein
MLTTNDKQTAVPSILKEVNLVKKYLKNNAGKSILQVQSPDKNRFKLV